MPFCTECGNKFSDDSKFCPNCGKPNLSQIKQESSREGLRSQTDISESGNYGEQDNSFLRNKTDVSNQGNYGLNIHSLETDSMLENNRYTILEKLGAGGFGVVYKASDSFYDGELKALKIIYSENYSDRLVMYKLKLEAKNMIKINHPNVVRL